MLCVGTSIAILIIARILQGLSTAFVWVVAMALLVDTVDPAHIGKDMGYVGTVSAIGTAAGPLLGGVVYARGGYYAVFAMAFALLGVDIVLRLLLIEKRSVQVWEVVSVPSAVEVARPECLRLKDDSIPDEEKLSTARPSSVGERGGQAMESEALNRVKRPPTVPCRHRVASLSTLASSTMGRLRERDTLQLLRYRAPSFCPPHFQLVFHRSWTPFPSHHRPTIPITTARLVF